MAILNNNPLVGASGNQGSYNINNSLRFRSSASAYLNRTPSSAGNQQIWTWSAWVKRANIGAQGGLFLPYTGGDGSQESVFRFETTDKIRIYDSGATRGDLNSSRVFRDPSAWYHIVLSVDLTQATNTNRVRLYVNNELETLTGTYPTQNTTWGWNNTSIHYIGSYRASSSFLDGYLADINFINGQALTPSSFGETDAVTGVWKAKKYTGTYGTNGFYLKFSDIATTSGSNAGLGKDFSGNSNYWTTNNISVTSGTTYDAMIDSPTNASISDTQPVGNYCTLNPLSSNLATKPQEGNLYFNTDPSDNAFYIGTMGVSSGKWYWEYQVTSQYCSMGVTQLSYSYGYFPTSSGSLAYANYSGTKYNNGTSGGSYITVANGDKIGIALDLDSGTITMYKNNVSQGVMYSGLSGTFFPLLGGPNGWGAGYVNFGQRPFAYTPPTGHKAICTTNLSDSTIKKGNSYMDATLWTGDGNASQTVVNSGSMKPDFLWAKCRSTAGTNNVLIDSVRGTNMWLASDSTAADASGTLSTFLSNGIAPTSSGLNTSTRTYVGWQWQAGQGSTSNITVNQYGSTPSIASTVSVNTTAGFSVVTYAGNSTSSATVGHGLGVSPSMVIIKNRSSVTNWVVRHSSLSSTQNVSLNTTDAAYTVSSGTANGGVGAFTSTTFGFISGTTGLLASNQTSNNYVAYCFAEIAGFSRFGSYTGNGNADGPFVYTGFRPKFILYKNSSFASTGWAMLDSSRNTYNVLNARLFSESSGAEDTSVSPMDFTSNGFKVRSTNDGVNRNGDTIIYMAFAENPFKNSLAR